MTAEALQLGLFRSQRTVGMPSWRVKQVMLEGDSRQISGRSCQLVGRSPGRRGISMMPRQWG